ncbi:integrator complex subunit 10 [Galendromus occidentalis]|uniref:Integrator complex subunit 10 n=1 Tax=Galendromus occidentalis TaxID=34638 RepID=A0AAJ7SFR4_9ACAR|nr:integrator complex subunit 10 [Galendromus occidentalis]
MCDDPFRAEAWLITAKTLFPNSFAIQFAMYDMYKGTHRSSDAARELANLMSTFPSEQGLASEMKSIAGAIQDSTTVIDSSRQLVAIFKHMTPAVQYDLLLSVCDNAIDITERCRFLLLVMRRFPESTAKLGPPLIEELLSNQNESQIPVSIHRKLLVCDVLPLILPRLQLPAKLVVELLEHSLVFYVRYMSSSDKYLDLPMEPKELWDRLFNLTRLIAQKLDWNLADLLETTNISDSQLSRLKSFGVPRSSIGIVDLSKSRVVADDEIQRFYITLVLFLRSVHFYGRFTSVMDDLPGCVLTDFRETHPQVPKKKKIDRGSNQLSASKHLSGNIAFSLINHFQTAVKTWSLLINYKEDFDRLSETVGLPEWPFSKIFFIDSKIYHGQHDEAIRMQCNLMVTAKTGLHERLTANVRLASCFFATGDRQNALARVLEVITDLPETAPESGESTGGSTLSSARNFCARVPESNQLCFILCSRVEILRFCVRLIMLCLKDRIADQRDDSAMGHLIVLCQSEWPTYETQFHQLIENIRKVKAFSYPLFMTYIVLPDILEEFAYLATQPSLELENSRLQLDLLPPAPGLGARSRTVTRGVNRGAKEDLRLAMEKQMARSEEDVDQIIVSFLLNEGKLILGK